MQRTHRLTIGLSGIVAAGVLLAALLAPYVYAEYEFNLRGEVEPLGAVPDRPVSGRWVDDYFLIEQIDPDTFAIGEPRYYQGNYSYLITGTTRAVLFDAGTGTRDIAAVVRGLTKLPVTVIPSHLHFDHVGGLGHFQRTALIDDASLRARLRGGQLTLGRYEFMGFMDRLTPPTFRVDEWWTPGSSVDLGGRTLRVLATPGHTRTSVGLYDEQRHELFSGDFIYPSELYAFLPGASRSAYLATTRRLLSTVAPDTRIFAAHMADPPAPVRAPVLTVADLQRLQDLLEGIAQGSAHATGFYPRIFPLHGSMIFATGLPWNNR